MRPRALHRRGRSRSLASVLRRAWAVRRRRSGRRDPDRGLRGRGRDPGRRLSHGLHGPRTDPDPRARQGADRGAPAQGGGVAPARPVMAGRSASRRCASRPTSRSSIGWSTTGFPTRSRPRDCGRAPDPNSAAAPTDSAISSRTCCRCSSTTRPSHAIRSCSTRRSNFGRATCWRGGIRRSTAPPGWARATAPRTCTCGSRTWSRVMSVRREIGPCSTSRFRSSRARRSLAAPTDISSCRDLRATPPRSTTIAGARSRARSRARESTAFRCSGVAIGTMRSTVPARAGAARASGSASSCTTCSCDFAELADQPTWSRVRAKPIARAAGHLRTALAGMWRGERFVRATTDAGEELVVRGCADVRLAGVVRCGRLRAGTERRSRTALRQPRARRPRAAARAALRCELPPGPGPDRRVSAGCARERRPVHARRVLARRRAGPPVGARRGGRDAAEAGALRARAVEIWIKISPISETAPRAARSLRPVAASATRRRLLRPGLRGPRRLELVHRGSGAHALGRLRHPGSPTPGRRARDSRRSLRAEGAARVEAMDFRGRTYEPPR